MAADLRRDELGILALVPDDWSVAWQRRHQVLTRLAAHAHVAWISPPLYWREWLARRQQDSRVHPAPDPRMFVMASADGVPAVRASAPLSRAVMRRRARRGAHWLRNRGCRSIELQIWLPEFADALDWGLHSSSSYHIDDEYSWSPTDQPLSPVERRLIERVDRVFVTSRTLLETKGRINPRTIFSSNGVDYRAFSTPASEPADLARIPHPRIGYLGVLKEQLDWDLLTSLAESNSRWSFVFVGPVRAGHKTLRPVLARLQRLPNVHLLGEKRVAELPGYMQHIDVSLLPYRRNAYTAAINPMKLYESLAAGVPIVSARIRTVEDFASVITIADGADEWTSGIANALSAEAKSAAQRSARQAAARPYDWDAIAAAVLP